MSWVFGDDHYKGLAPVTVSVACLGTLTALWPCVPSIVQNLRPFTGIAQRNNLNKNIRRVLRILEQDRMKRLVGSDKVNIYSKDRKYTRELRRDSYIIKLPTGREFNT